MIIEEKIIARDDRVRPMIDLQSITSGEEFRVMTNALSEMKSNKNNREAINHACIELAKSLRVCFGIDCTINVVSEVDSMGFYAFNIFPGVKCMSDIIDHLAGVNTNAIRESWAVNRNWHIDVDGRMLYDFSNKLTCNEMTALLLYCIEQVIFDYDTPVKIAYTITKYRTKMGFLVNYLADTERLRNIYRIPFMVGCAETNFILRDELKMNQLKVNSYINFNDGIFKTYTSAVQKLLVTYGNSDIIDRKDNEIEAKVNFILEWIHEGLADLRLSPSRITENLKRYIVACRSPYVRLVFKKILISIAGKVNTGAQPIVSEGYVNPAMKAMQEKLELENIKNFAISCEARAVSEYLDSHGNCKKVTNEDIDMIRVEAENIGSVNDKVYLLERLYTYIGRIDTALELIDTKQANKVKQTKSQLLALKDMAAGVRLYIINYKIQPERYGLYVKYPKGYEG